MEPVTNASSTISVIVPTIGRPDSLRKMLASLGVQTRMVNEVIVADGSDDNATQLVVNDPTWLSSALHVRRIICHPPNAVRQREAAIKIATGDFLLLLDDDVVLEPDCVEELFRTLDKRPGVVAAFADFANQSWPQPTTLWKLYLRLVHGLRDGEWNGRVIGPLLRFGYNPVPVYPQPIQWLGAGNSMVRKRAFELAGGFSDFFLHRCTVNEDVDLGIKLSRQGQIVFSPSARLKHYHAPGGRVPVDVAAEDDVYNRFMVMHQTMKFSRWRSLFMVLIYIFIESLSNVLGTLKRAKMGTTLQLITGRGRGVAQIGRFCFRL